MNILQLEASKPERMSHDLFESIRDDITVICKRINATRGNGKTEILAQSIVDYFQMRGIPEQYRQNRDDVFHFEALNPMPAAVEKIFEKMTDIRLT